MGELCLELQRGQVGRKKERKINKYKWTDSRWIDKTPTKKNTDENPNRKYRWNLRDIYRITTGD